MLRNGGMIVFVVTAMDWVGCSSVLELTAMIDERNDMIRILNSLERSQMRLEISGTHNNKISKKSAGITLVGEHLHEWLFRSYIDSRKPLITHDMLLKNYRSQKNLFCVECWHKLLRDVNRGK